MNTIAIHILLAIVSLACVIVSISLVRQIKKNGELSSALSNEIKKREDIKETTKKRDLFCKFSDSDFIAYSVELYRDRNGSMKVMSVPFEIFLTKERYIERRKLYREHDGFYKGMNLLFTVVKDIQDQTSPTPEWSYKQMYDNKGGEMLVEIDGRLSHM